MELLIALGHWCCTKGPVGTFNSEIDGDSFVGDPLLSLSQRLKPIFSLYRVNPFFFVFFFLFHVSTLVHLTVDERSLNLASV